MLLKFHKTPMIVSGDFNINFLSDVGLQLIKFFKDILNLDLLSSRTISTTRQGTTIDAIFGRFVNHLSSDT